MAKFNIIDATGSAQEIEFEVEAYKEAADQSLSLSQLVNRKYPTDPSRGTAFEQCMQQAGLFLRTDRASGIHPPTMKEVLEGNNLVVNLGAITQNDGAQRNTVSGRLLFPEVILQIIESQLTTNYGDFLQGYENMVAVTSFVTSPRVDQPVVNITAPQSASYRSQPIGQLAEPAALVTITVSEKSYRVPTKSIGLTISDQAMASATLDLVGIALTQQANYERVRLVEDSITGMISGDVDTDVNGAALTPFHADTLDSTISADGALTQKAWIKYLRQNYRKMSISHIMCDIDTALAIENRTGKPVITTDNPNSPRIDSLFSVENLGIRPPRVLLLDTALVGANTIVGLDNRFAIRRVVNVSAAYSAIEAYVMRRATSFRVDYGEMSHKLMADAWSMMTLINT